MLGKKYLISRYCLFRFFAYLNNHIIPPSSSYLSDKELEAVVLARFNRNLRSRKMSDILWGDLRLVEATDEAVDAPEDVVLSLGLPTSRVPMKQCVSAMIFYELRAFDVP